jgi:hypothetical protein
VLISANQRQKVGLANCQLPSANCFHESELPLSDDDPLSNDELLSEELLSNEESPSEDELESEEELSSSVHPSSSEDALPSGELAVVSEQLALPFPLGALMELAVPATSMSDRTSLVTEEDG